MKLGVNKNVLEIFAKSDGNNQTKF